MRVVQNHIGKALTCLIRVACFVVALSWFSAPDIAAAQQADGTDAAQTDVEAESAEGDNKEEEERTRPLLDLGSFKISDLRPTRNETAKLTFSMHLAFSKSLSDRQVEQLEGWKHRLRDQVITAVRIAYIKDFQEPDLSRLRRIILIRVNRLFKQNLAEEVLFGEYMFRTN